METAGEARSARSATLSRTVLHSFCTGFPQAKWLTRNELPSFPQLCHRLTGLEGAPGGCPSGAASSAASGWSVGGGRERSRVEAPPRAPRLGPMCLRTSRPPEKLFFFFPHPSPSLRRPARKLLIPLVRVGGSPFSPSPPYPPRRGVRSPARGVDFRPFESYSRERVTWWVGETG